MSRYFKITRTQTYSLLFALPLLLLYEAGALYVQSGFRNGADVLLRSLLLMGGINSTVAVTALLIAAAGVVIFLERKRRAVPLRLAPFLGMAVESTAYALTLGLVVGAATQLVLDGLQVHLASGGLTSLPLHEGVVLSLGAGVYEELLFRVLLVGGIFTIFRASGLKAGQAGLFSVVLASLVFSAFHYIGPYGDAWALPSFLFRFLAGLLFSALFLLRGFGITAWTHALYDVFLVVAMKL